MTDHDLMRPLPDFVVVGAMKSATTTLHEQLALQPCVFMSRPKEPNFFSDDEQYAKGLDWYSSLFEAAGGRLLRGESSTHYTKLPTYPHTVERMARALPRVKLVYLMRHPVDRLRSHYNHERAQGRIATDLEEAVARHPELVDYGRYAMQLEPYLRTFGPGRVLPVFFDRLTRRPDDEFERIGRFLGAPGALRWDHGLKPQNVGRELLRHSRLRNAVVRAPMLGTLRRRLVPRAWNERAKGFWEVRRDPPPVPRDLAARLREAFDRDLARLGSWLGIALDCDSFRRTVELAEPSWTRRAPAPGRRAG